MLDKLLHWFSGVHQSVPIMGCILSYCEEEPHLWSRERSEQERQQRLEQHRLDTIALNEQHKYQPQAQAQAQPEQPRTVAHHQQQPQAPRPPPQPQRQQRTLQHDSDRTDAIGAFADFMDTFIRKQPGFDHSNPRAYKHSLNAVNSGECQFVMNQLRAIALLPTTASELVTELAQQNKYFTVHNGRSFSLKNLTPYQLDGRRVFGEYKCNCRRTWSSAGSWKDKYQKCQSCERKIYPYSQSLLKPPQEGSEREDLRPHDVARCQMCTERGELCLPSRYYAV